VIHMFLTCTVSPTLTPRTGWAHCTDMHGQVSCPSPALCPHDVQLRLHWAGCSGFTSFFPPNA